MAEDTSGDIALKHLLKDPGTNYYTQLNDSTTVVTDDEFEDLSKSVLETTAGSQLTKSSRKKSSIASDFFSQSKATMFSSGVNLCNANIGAGMLGLPFAVRDSGWLMGIMLFIIFSCLTIFSFNLLTAVGHCYYREGRTSSYAIVCNDIAPRLQVVIDVCIVFGSILTNAAYLIVIGDYMPLVTMELAGMSPSTHSDSMFITREFWIIIFLIVLILPTTALKKLDELRFSSMIAIGCFIYVTIIVIIFFLVDSDSLHIGDDDKGEIAAEPSSVFDFFKAAPIFITAYGGHPLAFIVTNELYNPTLRRINITLVNTFVFVTAVYVTVGLFGYLTFGNKTQSNILLNYPDNNVLIIIVRIGLSVAVAFSYSVIASFWKESMAALLFGVDKQGKDAKGLVWYKYYTLVAILIFSTLTISMLTDDLGVVLKIKGATGSAFLQIIAPGLIYYYYDKLHVQTMVANPWHNLKLKGSICLIVFGCIMIPFGTTLVFV